MENIILGLLLLKPRSVYQLRKRIEQGLNLMFSSSTGSIQFAIKKAVRATLHRRGIRKRTRSRSQALFRYGAGQGVFR